MNNTTFSKKLLEKIKNEEIKQTPKYIFVFKNIFIWLFLSISIILLSISLAINFDYLVSADLILFKKIGFLKVLIVFLPIFWLIFLILSSFLSYYNYRHTNKGYKVSLLKIFTVNIITSFVLAFLLYFSWSISYIESKLEYYIPKYRSILVDDKVSRMVKVWQNEDKWLLIGEIIKVEKNKLIFKDFNSKNWNIIINDKTNTNIKHRVNIEPKEKIKIIWDKISNSDFKAFEIRPFIWKNIINIINIELKK